MKVYISTYDNYLPLQGFFDNYGYWIFRHLWMDTSCVIFDICSRFKHILFTEVSKHQSYKDGYLLYCDKFSTMRVKWTYMKKSGTKTYAVNMTPHLIQERPLGQPLKTPPTHNSLM